MTTKLKHTYFKLLIPACLGFIVVWTISDLNVLAIDRIKYPQFLAPAIFILSVLFAVALPIFLRTLFAHNMRHELSVSESKMFKFEQCQIYFISVTPYLALTAYFLKFPRFYFASCLLCALYAVYFYYPSDNRIEFDKRVFRVK